MPQKIQNPNAVHTNKLRTRTIESDEPKKSALECVEAEILQGLASGPAKTLTRKDWQRLHDAIDSKPKA